MKEECPHCHMKTGYIFTKTVRHTEFRGFDGECLSVDGSTVYENKKVECFECKKQFYLET